MRVTISLWQMPEDRAHSPIHIRDYVEDLDQVNDAVAARWLRERTGYQVLRRPWMLRVFIRATGETGVLARAMLAMPAVARS